MTTTHSTTVQLGVTSPAAGPVAPSSGVLRPLGVDEVTITGGLWAERQQINHDATLPHIEYWLEREGWLANFDLAADGGLAEGRRGREFADSEVYKYLEALAWEIGRTDDAALEQRFRAVVSRVARAQEPDGYLHTNFGHTGQPARFSDLEWGHELYCLGHLFQAAVARHRTRPDADDGLVEVARRAADLVCSEFADGARETVCGHAEIEPALVELGRALDEPRYIEQSRLFVERRGHHVLKDIEYGRDYFQDDVPIREAGSLRGHAVRANYLAAGAVDVAVETADRGLLDVLAHQWDRTAERRTYITGGQGSHHQDEAFGEDYVLPADRAYSETCAGVGSIMFSWRLLLARGDAAYADLIERTLFNVVATSPSEEGKAFFYTNTLHMREPGHESTPDVVSPRASSSLRAPWFDVACCPPNVARTFASLATLLATVDDEGLQVHQYAPSVIRTHLGDGRAVAVEIDTDYPVSGRIRVRILEAPESAWTLSLRVPEWAEGATLTVDSAEVDAAPHPVAPGTATVHQVFGVGDVVELDIPIAPHLVVPDRRIDAIRGTVAVERGPEVYCLESIDAPFADLADVRLAASEVRTIDGGVAIELTEVPPATGWPYGVDGEPDATTARTATVPLVPYRTWGNRGPTAMRIWIPRD